jgi:hypothetical protein
MIPCPHNRYAYFCASVGMADGPEPAATEEGGAAGESLRVTPEPRPADVRPVDAPDPPLRAARTGQ